MAALVAAAASAADGATTPETTMVTGPEPVTSDPAPTFTFSSPQTGATFECRIDDAAFAACASPLTAPRLAPGQHSFEVRAVDGPGNADPTPAGMTFRVTEQPAPPPPPAGAPAAPPDFGDSANADPDSGDVLVQPPGTTDFVPLTDVRNVPDGTIVDATDGRVTITSAVDAGGRTQSADFYGGQFRLQLPSGRSTVTELVLVGGDFGLCAAPSGSSRPARSAVKKRKNDSRVVRSLWGDGKGRFRTRGRYGAATVRGTRWLTEDRCDSTRLKVTRGTVVATDLPRARDVKLRAGRQYIARARP